MKIEHFFGKIIIKDISEIGQIFNIKSEKGVNEFWISLDEEYPCVCVSINKSYAHVHYFDEEGEPGFQAIGNLDLGDQNIKFYTNSLNEEILVEEEFVINIPKAVEIVEEFFLTKSLPKCVEWDEL